MPTNEMLTAPVAVPDLNELRAQVKARDAVEARKAERRAMGEALFLVGAGLVLGSALVALLPSLTAIVVGYGVATALLGMWFYRR